MQQVLADHGLPPSSVALVPGRFSALILSCLDAELFKSAVFYAERYYSLDNSNHDARHLYALTLLKCGQTHAALYLVNNPSHLSCSGCLEVKAKCCSRLGMHGKAREALAECTADSNYLNSGTFTHLAVVHSLLKPLYFPSAGSSSRDARIFPEEAVLQCRAGFEAMKGNLLELATQSFRQALVLNPMIWEAFEGLCAVGELPSIVI